MRACSSLGGMLGQVDDLIVDDARTVTSAAVLILIRGDLMDEEVV